MPPKVELAQVCMRYVTRRGETEALRSIDLQVAPGEFVAVVGPSGCGKSTILSLVAGILKPTSGVVRIDGVPVTGPSRRVGYMLQHDHLFEWRSVLENCLLGAEIQGIERREARERAIRLLGRCGLTDFLHAHPAQLSGGMRQRVALVRTLTTDPQVLLLDEPFSALDYQTRLMLGDEVAGILRTEGKTAILVTHDIGEAIAMADRVVVLTHRPTAVKAEHTIEMGQPRLAPFAVRQAQGFNGYFSTIWEELEVHASD